MLESLTDCPSSVGEDITVFQWILSILLNFLVIGIVLGSSYFTYDLLVRQYRLSVLTVAGWWLFLVILITAVLYVYYVYIVDMKNGAADGTKSSSGKKQKSSSKLFIVCAFQRLRCNHSAGAKKDD